MRRELRIPAASEVAQVLSVPMGSSDEQRDCVIERHQWLSNIAESDH